MPVYLNGRERQACSKRKIWGEQRSRAWSINSFITGLQLIGGGAAPQRSGAVKRSARPRIARRQASMHTKNMVEPGSTFEFIARWSVRMGSAFSATYA